MVFFAANKKKTYKRRLGDRDGKEGSEKQKISNCHLYHSLSEIL
jgi:hypothetical protein